MLKVLIFTCRQSAQRINYYNALGKLCDLTVVAERQTPKEVLDAYNAYPETYKTIYLHGIPMFGYMAFCPGVLEILRKNKEYDAIIVEQYFTPTAPISINYLSRHKVPFIISADGRFIFEKERNYKRKLKSSLISKATLWMTGGKESIKYLAHYDADPARTKIFRFASYKENDQPDHQITKEEREAIRKELGINEEKVILSVGRQVQGKGFDVLLRAFGNLNLRKGEAGLYILGGDPNEECQEILKNMDTTNIHFPGLANKETLKLYYTAADMLAFPTRYDVWGFPVTEAISFALPIIVTDQCKAGLELIKDEINGYLIESDDVDTLADRIKRLLENEEKRQDMAKANYLLSKEYNSEKMAESVFEIISDFSKEISAGNAHKK